MLYANSQLSSIVKWALTLSEIRVQGPFGVVKLLPDYKLSIDDILARLSASQSEPEEKEDAGFPRAIIENFRSVTDTLSSRICRVTNRSVRNSPPFHSP